MSQTFLGQFRLVLFYWTKLTSRKGSKAYLQSLEGDKKNHGLKNDNFDIDNEKIDFLFETHVKEPKGEAT